MTRIQTVFQESEIAHVWANRGAITGHTPLVSFMNGGKGRRQSFDGDAFYSYDTVIARRIGHKGKTAYILDVASFGPTTGKHLRMIRSAMRNSDWAFEVECGKRGQSLYFTPASLRDHYLDTYRETLPVSRYQHVVARAFCHRAVYLSKAIDVCRYFGLSHKTLDREQNKIGGKLNECRAIVQEYDGKLSNRREERRDTERKNRLLDEAHAIERAIKLAEECIIRGKLPDINYYTGWGHAAFGYQDKYLESRPDLLTGIKDLRAKRDAASISDWLAGKPATPNYDWPTVLRVEKAYGSDSAPEMVTSKGARVPLSAAKHTYAFIMAHRSAGWKTNGETHEIGMYRLESVNAQGVVVGCHRVTWEEIDRFAALMGWNTPAI